MRGDEKPNCAADVFSIAMRELCVCNKWAILVEIGATEIKPAERASHLATVTIEKRRAVGTNLRGMGLALS